MQDAGKLVCGRATAAELATVESLWASTFAVPERQRARWLSPQRVRVVRVDDKLRGACTLSWLRLATPEGLRRCVWLRALAVDEEARGHGVGSALVQHVLARTRVAGLPVALRSPVRGLYARAGLQPAGRVHGLEMHLPATVQASAVAASPMAASPVHAMSLDRAQIEQLALRCAREHGGWVPLPGQTLRSALRQHALGLRSPDGLLLAACAVAREGVPWLAARDVTSGAQLLEPLARARLRVDAYAPWQASPPAITSRDLGPWWCSEASWSADLPASVLSCLD